ncbi:hypothetical protein ACLKA7_000919 [Drosophila subpalustris]
MENTTEIFDIEDAYINCGPSSDESKLITFLEERGLSSSYPYLKKSQVTFESLEYLTEDDIKEVITPVGIRALFRVKLIEWKKQTFGAKELPPSLQSNFSSVLLEESVAQSMKKEST